MNIARVGLLVVAVAAAGTAAFLVRSMTHKPHEAHATVKKPTFQVLVASHAIEPGSTVKAGDFHWEDWPGTPSPSFMTAQGTPKALNDTVGMTVHAHIDQGEPITNSKLVKGGSAGFMAAMLAPGMRAISTKIDEESAAGGFILPGDRVDVVMTRRVDHPEGGSSETFESRTVLSDVKVLAIGQTYAETNGDKTVQGKTATLELAPAEAERLALVGAMGNVTLVLRSAANGDITGATKPRSVGMGGSGDGMIRVVRYARVTRVIPAQVISSGDGQ